MEMAMAIIHNNILICSLIIHVQWLDEDGDGLGDNQSGTDADPFLDFDNDGFNDSIDILPKLASLVVI